jgi:hypothetical protein
VTPLQSRIEGFRKAVTSRLIPREPNRKGSSYAVTVITPIRPDQTAALSDELDKLKPGKSSPFYDLPDVQFARWVIIEQLLTDWRGAPKPPPTVASPYLLFGADLTAPAYRADRLPDSFFRDMATRIEVTCNAVWGNCLECPDASDVDAFVDYLKDSQINVGLYYSAFPDLTAAEIANVLSVREQFARFARDHQGEMLQTAGLPAHEKLLNAYRSEAAKWPL